MQKGIELGKSSRLGAFWKGCEIPLRFDQMKQYLQISISSHLTHDGLSSLCPFLCTFHFCLNQIFPHSDCNKDFFFLVSNFFCVGSQMPNLKAEMQLCSRAPGCELLRCHVNLGPHSSHKIRLVGCDSEKFHPQTFPSHQHV